MKPPKAQRAVISASFAPKDSLARSVGSGSTDIIFISHLSFFFHIRQAYIFFFFFFFLEFAFGAMGIWEKVKLADCKNKAGIKFRYEM